MKGECKNMDGCAVVYVCNRVCLLCKETILNIRNEKWQTVLYY